MAPKYSAALAAEFPAFDPELAPDAEDADIDHSEQEELEMPAPHLPEASDPDGLLRAARPGSCAIVSSYLRVLLQILQECGKARLGSSPYRFACY